MFVECRDVVFVVPVKDCRLSWDSLSFAAPSLSYICNCLSETRSREWTVGWLERKDRENLKLHRRRRRRRGDFKTWRKKGKVRKRGRGESHRTGRRTKRKNYTLQPNHTIQWSLEILRKRDSFPFLSFRFCVLCLSFSSLVDREVTRKNRRTTEGVRVAKRSFGLSFLLSQSSRKYQVYIVHTERKREGKSCCLSVCVFMMTKDG